MPKAQGKTKVQPHALADCRWVAMALIGDGLHAFGTTIKAPQPVRGTSMNKAPRRGRR